MIEKWKTAVDNGGVFAALLTDLSKAFDCILHDLIIAKLAAYGFDTQGRIQGMSSLSDRLTSFSHKYLTKINIAR